MASTSNDNMLHPDNSEKRHCEMGNEHAGSFKENKINCSEATAKHDV